MRSAITSRMLALCAGLALTAAIADSALAAGGFSSRTTVPTPTGNIPIRRVAAVDTCNLITFEGIPDNSPVGILVGDVTVTFGTSWLGVIDGDAGGSGNFANEPSPSTAAYFLDTSDISIGLNPGVRFVRFQYSASAVSLPIVVTAFDAFGNPVDSATGNTLGTDIEGAACTGDPNGNFCLWGTITLVSPTDIIRSVTITGTVANQFGIDDLLFCVAADPVSTRKGSWGSLKVHYR